MKIGQVRFVTKRIDGKLSMMTDGLMDSRVLNSIDVLITYQLNKSKKDFDNRKVFSV
jgi:hypothetical protein